jgi:hypothetical protein
MNDSRFAIRSASRAGLVALLACVGAAWSEDFKLGDVKPGLTGTALTAGVGNALERFDIRVLETVQDGDQPLILVRATGAFLDSVGGVGQGFSGSPVYIGDKLLGAISGGFPNGDGRLVLVTPIERMRRATPPTPAALLTVLPSSLRRACLPDLGCAVPLATPLTVSGLGNRALGVLRNELEAKGLDVPVAPLQTSGSSPARNFNYKLEPGAPIAAQLVSGDISVGATGTVTTAEGRNVLAFGHPVFGDTRVRSLMQGAYVAGFVSSSVVPFKIAQAVGEPIGTFVNDRPYGLGGVVGSLNPLPLEITVRRGTASRVTKLNLAPVPDLSGVLLLASSYGALDNLLEGDSPGSARLTLRLEFNDRAPVEYGDRVADGDDIARTAARRAALLLALIAENPYAAPNFKRVSVTLEVAPYNALRIVKADLERKTMKAGEATTMNVRLQPFRAGSVQRRVAFRIPTDAQPGTVRLRVRGAGTPRPQVDALQNPDPWDGVLTFEELLERMRSRATGEACIVETTGSDPQAVGLENVGEVVTGWVYVDVQVVK